MPFRVSPMMKLWYISLYIYNDVYIIVSVVRWSVILQLIMLFYFSFSKGNLTENYWTICNQPELYSFVSVLLTSHVEECTFPLFVLDIRVYRIRNNDRDQVNMLLGFMGCWSCHLAQLLRVMLVRESQSIIGVWLVCVPYILCAYVRVLHFVKNYWHSKLVKKISLGLNKFSPRSNLFLKLRNRPQKTAEAARNTKKEPYKKEHV